MVREAQAVGEIADVGYESELRWQEHLPAVVTHSVVCLAGAGTFHIYLQASVGTFARGSLALRGNSAESKRDQP